MFTYLLINDVTNQVVQTNEPSMAGYRRFGKYFEGKQISCFTGKTISTIEEDINLLTTICGLTLKDLANVGGLSYS